MQHDIPSIRFLPDKQKSDLFEGRLGENKTNIGPLWRKKFAWLWLPACWSLVLQEECYLRWDTIEETLGTMRLILLFHLVIIYTQAHDHARKGFIITTKNGKRYLAKGPTKHGARESESPHDYADYLSYLRQKRLENFQMQILKRDREQGLPGKNLATLPERWGFVYDMISSHDILLL